VSVSLVILCLAAFAMVAVLVSGVVGAALPWIDRFAAKLSPRHRARLWLGLAALPSVVAALAVGASFLPAMGIGHDHCLAHGPHHPHLCPHHLGAAPGIVLVFIALVLSARLVHVLASLGRNIQLSRDTSSSLAEASDVYSGAFVFPSDEPQAFVLGTFWPRVHVSAGLLALGRDIVEPVLAHERVHARRRDLLWRTIFPVIAVGHLPTTTESLRLRLCAAQEMAADAEAADTLHGGPLKIAEALLVLARASRVPAPGISFTGGDLKSRVHALLEGRSRFAAWPARALLLSALVLPALLGASHDLIHHGLETLLGALS
jgi:Zn-dependent protease with chaperone function